MNSRIATVALFAASLATGCSNHGLRTIKSRGVYTVAYDESMQTFEVPQGAYVQQDVFTHGQKPFAMVVGYDNVYFTLELIDLSSGKTLASINHFIGSGRAAGLHLPASSPGRYKARLMIHNSEYDASTFTVLP